MKFIDNIFFLIIIFFTSGCSVSSQYAKRASWRDEFSVRGQPDAKMWIRSVTDPGVQLSGYRDEDEVAYVKNGLLHLRVCRTNDPKLPYKAGRVVIGDDFNFKKGKLVIRAKAPTTAGLWPAIWLNGPKTKDGYFVELDLMEHIHAMGDSSYTAVYHLWGDFRGEKSNHVSYGKEVAVNVGEWHTYTLEILDETIRMSVDNSLVYAINKGDYGEEWPKDQEYSLRIALAYGGWAASKTGINDAALPAELLIDYVRFYHLK